MKQPQKPAFLYANLLAASIAAASTATWAQPDTKNALVLEEVIVSARRVEEGIQSVPISIVALNNESLREDSITSFQDLQTAVPGIYLAGSGGPANPVYVIRGQSKGLLGTSSPAVVSYFADVPQPSWGSNVPQFDMATIQVLKGPQGTLFGRNTTGGAILYNPEAPTHEFGGYVSGTLGDEDHRRAQGVVNVPLVQDKVALRLGADFNERDAWTQNIGVGGDPDNLDTEIYRATLLTDFDQLSNTLIMDYFKSDNDGFNVSLRDVYHPSGVDSLGLTEQVDEQFAAQKARGIRKITSSFPQYEKNERTTIVNRTEYTFDNEMVLINIFGYQETDLAYAPNVDGLPILSSPVVQQGIAGSAGIPADWVDVDTTLVKAVLIDQTKQTSNELQLRGTAFNDRMEWLVGGFWVKTEPDGAGQINATTIFVSEYAINIPGMAPITGLTPATGAQYLFITDESKAAFAHFNYDLTDALALEVGVRYTDDKFDACIGSGAVPAYNGQKPANINESACKQGDTSQIVNSGEVGLGSDEVTWNVGLNWQATDEIFLYGVYRHGYRAGGANGPIYDDLMETYQTFDPEKVDSFETGIKADWNIGGMLARTNVSYFYDEISDAQGDIGGGVTTPRNCDDSTDPVTNPGPDGDCDPTDDPTGGALVLNLGDTSIQGVDLEFVLAPTERLTLSFNATFQDKDVDKLFKQDNEFIARVSGGVQPFLKFTKRSVQANVRYAVPMGSIAEELVLNANYYDTSQAGDGVIATEGYDVINLRADLNSVADWNLDVSVFVKNATDEDYALGSAAASTALGIGSYIYAPPRLWGVEARYRF
jgi:iron complex outermembrane recepter protein